MNKITKMKGMLIYYVVKKLGCQKYHNQIRSKLSCKRTTKNF